MQLYPNNKVAQYRIKLPRPINLDSGDWDVALTELSVLSIFDNVVSCTCYIKLIGPEHSINNSTVNYIIEPGHYNEDSLLRYLNHQVANYGILSWWKTVKWSCLTRAISKHISRMLMNKLGFVNMLNNGFGGGWLIAENQCDIYEETVQTLFIYCDILEHVAVSEVMAPLQPMVVMKHKQSHGKMHEHHMLCSM